MINWVHPGAVLILGALLIPFLSGKAKKVYLVIVPLIAFLLVATMDEGRYGIYHVLGQEVIFGRVDKLALAFAYIFSLMSFIGIIYGLHVEDDGHHVASFIYAGSSLGVSFAGDFISLIVFWEFLAFAAVFLILYRRTKKSYEAAYRYILVHVFGGACLLGGIMLVYSKTHSIAFDPVSIGGFPALLMLIGFIVNAAVPPLNAWLPDAYPEATVTGAVFLSAFTTKSAVYVLARGYAGTDALIWLGAAMTVYGVVYATMENDIRRLLSYHIISQVGYMVAGVGIGTEMAINGAVAHAFAHILYKGLLFMGAGSVLYMTGRTKLTELGGLYKTMPMTFILYMIGAFAISGVPLFSGFVSKSVTLSAAAEEHLMYPWLLMTLAASGTFLSVGLKLPYYAFIGKDAKIEAKEPPANMLIGMGIAALMCIFIGVYPKYLYDLLPYSIHYLPYTAEHVVWTLEILLLTWLGFYIFLKKLSPKDVISIDTDWFYRKGGVLFLRFADRVVERADNAVSGAYKTIILNFGCWLAKISFYFDVRTIDAVVNGVADSAVSLASQLRRFQTGKLGDYAVGMLFGLLILLNLFLILS